MRKLFYLLIVTLVLVSCGNGSKEKDRRKSSGRNTV